jgi:hypothetical protein
VVHPPRPRADKDVDDNDDRVESVHKEVEVVHPFLWAVERGPVDHGDEEGDCGDQVAEYPRDAVQRGHVPGIMFSVKLETWLGRTD